jgi:hypothetical protein
VMKRREGAEPDAFVAWSYPPDTFGLTEQAQIEDLEVGAFYTAVATSFPGYGGRFGAAANGILGAGGVNPDVRGVPGLCRRPYGGRRRRPRLLGLGHDLCLAADPAAGHRGRRRSTARRCRRI